MAIFFYDEGEFVVDVNTIIEYNTPTDEEFRKSIIKSHPTGSRYICNPPPMDTDNDTIYLVNGYYDWETSLIRSGWERSGDYNLEAYGFVSLRKGEENFIITEDPDWYKNFVLATEGAKALNLTNKEDRIKLFQAIQDEHFRLYEIENFFPYEKPVFED